MRWFTSMRHADDAGEFAGKVIAVYCREGQGGLVKDVRIERLGDRSFLTGQFAPRGTREWAEVTCWLAIDDVIKILVFDNIEEVRGLFAKGEQAGTGA